VIGAIGVPPDLMNADRLCSQQSLRHGREKIPASRAALPRDEAKSSRSDDACCFWDTAALEIPLAASDGLAPIRAT